MGQERTNDTPHLGPRGGRYTVTSGGFQRKGVLLRKDQAEALRLKAFQDRVSESQIFREALDAWLGLGE